MRKREVTTTANVQLTLPPQLLRIEQVADILNCCRAKVYRLIKLDDLPTVKVGDEMRVEVADLSRWIAERKQVQQVS